MTQERADNLWERFILLDGETQNSYYEESNASPAEELLEYLDKHWN